MNKSFRQSMAWLHTWVGLLLGWLLVAIFITGTSAYFRQEIPLWMEPETHDSTLTPNTLDMAVAVLNDKMVRRHPHVFPEGTLNSRRDGQAPQDDAIKARWEAIKSEERREKAQHSLMDDIPAALPALTRSAKLQKRARQFGFDWQDISGVVAALHDELEELEEARQSGDKAKIADEMGDVLFSAVNLCRHLSLDPEAVLRDAGRKFERRFRYVEARALEQGVASSSDEVNPQLDLFWTEAKRQGL